MKPQKFRGHDRDFLWSRDVIGHVIIGLSTYGFPLVSQYLLPQTRHIGGLLKPAQYLAGLLMYVVSIVRHLDKRVKTPKTEIFGQ